MNREIKFRAWDTKRKEMRQVQLMDWSNWWVSTGHTWERDNALEYGERNSFQNSLTDRHILMQYTGLKDKNGVDVYDGDIVRVDDGRYQGEVKWNDQDLSFVIENRDGGFGFINGQIFDEWPEYRTYEVIGNIYENPDLLNGEHL